MAQQPQENTLDTDDVALAFDLAGVGLCISRERVIQRCNREFGEMFGYSPEELMGRSLECLYPSHEEFRNIGVLGQTAMQETGRYCDERVMQRKDGSLFWCHVVGRSMYREKPFACAVWSMEDISLNRPVKAGLTGREREVAQIMITGKTSKEIAKLLAISPRTVEVYRARLMRKFEARTLIELTSKIIGSGR